MNRLLRFACWMTLFGLAMFVWAVLDPDPGPIMIALSLGQIVGTAASVLFVYVVFQDLRRSDER